MNRFPLRTIASGLSLLAVILDFGVAAFLLHSALYDRNWLTQTRNALFSDFVSDRSFFTASPEQMLAAGFSADSPQAIDEWRQLLLGEVEYAGTWLATRGSTIDRAQALVLLFSRNGAIVDGTHRCGEFEFRDLIDVLQRIGTDQGYGCCSDHSQAFLALSSIAGIHARELAHSQHVFSEFYSPELGQWIWVDPQFALMARTPGGDYLSLVEVRDLYQNGEEIDLVFFGNHHHVLDGRAPRTHPYYDQALDFADYRVTWGNNVFEQEEFRQRFEMIPISARQLLGLFSNSLPEYMMLVDENSHLPKAFRSRRRLCLGVFAALLLTNSVLALWLRERILLAR